MMPFNVDAAAYRRDRRLTLVVALGTAVLMLWSPLQAVLTGHVPDVDTVHGGNKWVNLVASCAVSLLVCWCAWRGGGLSTGCLTLLYSVGLVGFVLTSVISLLFFLVTHDFKGISIAFVGISLTGFDQQTWDTLSFLTVAIWTIFAVWVLVCSQDARFYRRARRRSALSEARAEQERWS